MITSYLGLPIRLSRELVSNNDLPDLFDLVGLALRTLGLEVDDFFDRRLGKDVMASSNPLVEAELPEQLTHIRKPNVCVGIAAQHREQNCSPARHSKNFIMSPLAFIADSGGAAAIKQKRPVSIARNGPCVCMPLAGQN
jgi:hypothetical protein